MQFTTLHWPHQPRRVFPALLILEFCCLTTLLGLVGYANPNTYRGALYVDGIASGYTTLKEPTPVIWRPKATTTLLYLTLISFLLLVFQAVLYILSFFPPLFALLFQLLLFSAWCGFSATYQIGLGSGGEVAWFWSRSCEKHVYYSQNLTYCRQAKGTLAVSVVLVAAYVAKACWAVWAMVRAGRERERGGKEELGMWKGVVAEEEGRVDEGTRMGAVVEMGEGWRPVVGEVGGSVAVEGGKAETAEASVETGGSSKPVMGLAV